MSSCSSDENQSVKEKDSYWSSDHGKAIIQWQASRSYTSYLRKKYLKTMKAYYGRARTISKAYTVDEVHQLDDLTKEFNKSVEDALTKYESSLHSLLDTKESLLEHN